MINLCSKNQNAFLKDLSRALLYDTSDARFSCAANRVYVTQDQGRAEQACEQYYNDLEVGEPLEG